LELPELPVAAAVRPQYRVDESTAPLWPHDKPDARHEWLDAAGGVTLVGARWSDTYYLCMPGVAGARVGADARVTVWRDPAAGAASLRHALVDQILPRVLAGDGALMLHAAAVADAGAGAMLVLGDSGFGKSTLSVAFARAGARLLSDDCVRLELAGDGVQVIPTYPGIRLRPDSLAALYGDSAPATTPMAHYTDKRRIVGPVATDGAGAGPAAASAIVVLQPPGTDTGIAVTRLPSAAACIALVRNSFALDPADLVRSRALLARAADVARVVPVYAVGYPRDYARLPEVIARLRTLVRA
jgi:hypothetical protein